MPITIHDVARRARVSVTTVSCAPTEPRLVKESTLARVLAAAKQLAYRPNPAARSLITGKTGTIGIVVPDLENPFYTSILRGVQARAHQTGYAVLLADSGEDPGAEANLVHTMTNQVDGVIICSPFAADAQLAQQAGSDVSRPHQSRAARHSRGVDGFGERHAQGGRSSCRAWS